MEIKFEKLFKKILNCNGEDELAEIISKDSLLKDDKNWNPYGNNANNFSFFSKSTI